MPVATLTSKGQVIIPREVREMLKLRTGDWIDFRVEPDGTVRVVPLSSTVGEIFGILREKAKRSDLSKETKAKVREAFRKGRL